MCELIHWEGTRFCTKCGQTIFDKKDCPLSKAATNSDKKTAFVVVSFPSKNDEGR